MILEAGRLGPAPARSTPGGSAPRPSTAPVMVQRRARQQRRHHGRRPQDRLGPHPRRPGRRACRRPEPHHRHGRRRHPHNPAHHHPADPARQGTAAIRQAGIRMSHYGGHDRIRAQMPSLRDDDRSQRSRRLIKPSARQPRRRLDGSMGTVRRGPTGNAHTPGACECYVDEHGLPALITVLHERD